MKFDLKPAPGTELRICARCEHGSWMAPIPGNGTDVPMCRRCQGRTRRATLGECAQVRLEQAAQGRMEQSQATEAT